MKEAEMPKAGPPGVISRMVPELTMPPAKVLPSWMPIPAASSCPLSAMNPLFEMPPAKLETVETKIPNAPAPAVVARIVPLLVIPPPNVTALAT